VNGEFLDVFTTKSCKTVPISSTMSVCLSVCNNSRTAKRIFLELLYYRVLLKFVDTSNFGSDRTIMTDTLHLNVRMFLRAGVTGLGIP
jgi:hypothetical protein